ncbi:MAG: chemotaxis protein CheR [Hahellaceae bacterium]|nr:chemotaxis protein CheR [Hahellaceae bacterium]
MSATDAKAESREFNFTWAHFEHLRKISMSHTGIQVPDIKQEMFYARLSKRVRALRLNDFDQYIRYLEDNWDSEGTPFINALTTNLTSFFRENHHFNFLKKTVVAAAQQKKQRSIKIWSAGCSTGEEPYSIAMTMTEACSGTGVEWELTATDLDTDVLARAQRGVYALDRIEGIDQDKKKRFFMKGTGPRAGYVRVKEELRNKIQFRQLNLIKPIDMGDRYDVIFCRNVVIYFDRDTKVKLVEQFVRHLQPKAYLIMGHSESLHGISNAFEGLGNTIYQLN